MRFQKHFLASLLFACVFSTTASAQPSKYEFNFHPARVAQLPPGDVTFMWKLSNNWNVSHDQNESMEGKQFVATLMNLFAEVISRDTLSTPILHGTVPKDDAIILEINELGKNYSTQLMIAQRVSPLPPQNSRIDSLNFMLLNGYFSHAVRILHKMNRPDIITKVIEQHEALFPFDYVGSREIFNSYFDEGIDSLVTLPYIGETKVAFKSLKALNLPKLPRFEIRASIQNDKIVSVTTRPAVHDNSEIMESLENLQIVTHGRQESKLILIINTKKWKLVNKRALTDPASEEFRLRPRLVATGAVHRAQ